MNKYFNSGIIGGLVGAALILAIVVIVVVWWKPFDYRVVYIVEQTQVVNENRPVLTVSEADLMASLRDKGYLLTPAEYTNNMIGYYNTLIAFLAVFFVVFSVASYLSIRNISKKEVRDEAREILQDSSRFKDDVMEVLRGEFDGNYLSHEDYDVELQTMKEDIGSIKESLSLLKTNQTQTSNTSSTEAKQTVNPKSK